MLLPLISMVADGHEHHGRALYTHYKDALLKVWWPFPRDFWSWHISPSSWRLSCKFQPGNIWIAHIHYVLQQNLHLNWSQKIRALMMSYLRGNVFLILRLLRLLKGNRFFAKLRDISPQCSLRSPLPRQNLVIRKNSEKIPDFKASHFSTWRIIPFISKWLVKIVRLRPISRVNLAINGL